MKPTSYRKGIIALILFALFVAVITSFDTIGFALIIICLAVSGTMLLQSIVMQLREFRVYRRHSKDVSLKFLATVMGFFLVLGTGIYIYVFKTISHLPDDPHQFNNAEYLFRSLICSLDMFMLDVDSNILDLLKDHKLLKAWLSIQAVMSFACTVLMLVGLVYSRLYAYYKLAYKTNVSNAKSHLYLFFGINTPSDVLIKDIKRHDPKAVIILIDEANIKEDEHDEWNDIVGIIGHRRSTFEVAEKYDISVEIGSKHLSDIDAEELKLANGDTFNILGLNHSLKLLHQLQGVDDAQLHIFFLDEDEQRNIRDVSFLAKDKTIAEISKIKCIKHCIYCHARYNGPNRVIEDLGVRKHLNIKIVDSSHNGVECLKLHSEFHPYNVMTFDTENPTTVSGELNTLIVGFGEVGRDAFKFLYEFGTFVANDATDDKAHRCTFKCTIVDADLQNILGVFKASMPGIFQRKPENVNISFCETNHNSDEFHTQILSDDKVRKLNYVFITINNPDEAIALAARIFSRFRRAGGDLKKLRILVRCADTGKLETITKIANHYNYGYDKGHANTRVIRIFGQPEETYTYKLVISDKLQEVGQKFHKRYRSIKKEGEEWLARRQKLMSSPDPNIDDLRKLRRQESQDIANALHAHTKLAILRTALPDNTDWSKFFIRYFVDEDTPNAAGSHDNITYTALSADENRIILRLAQLEHLRWNAAHELMGYVPYSKDENNQHSCNETTMRHNCLINWDELDAESEFASTPSWQCDYKLYDFAVIDTTIALFKSEYYEQQV